jgi:hypothetical protein
MIKKVPKQWSISCKCPDSGAFYASACGRVPDMHCQAYQRHNERELGDFGGYNFLGQKSGIIKWRRTIFGSG